MHTHGMLMHAHGMLIGAHGRSRHAHPHTLSLTAYSKKHHKCCYCLLTSVRRSSLLDWKKDWIRTEPNCKRPNHRLQLHKFWIFSVASCEVCWKIEKPKKNRSIPVATGLSSSHVLDLTHTHIYLIFGLWIIKNGQELVEIWPKTFLYTTRMYVSSVFAISQPNLN